MLHDYSLYKSTFTLLYFTSRRAKGGIGGEKWGDLVTQCLGCSALQSLLLYSDVWYPLHDWWPRCYMLHVLSPRAQLRANRAVFIPCVQQDRRLLSVIQAATNIEHFWTQYQPTVTIYRGHRRTVCTCPRFTVSLSMMCRDQPNSRFHGRDIMIFREIGLLPRKTSISVKFREIRDFLWILTLLLSFMKVFTVSSTAFVWILLFATCHTSALSSWHVFTVLLTYIQSWVLT